ncbi:sphingosine 1-phosphate receptor 2-like [Mytilus trossulus]|uniref:sphingosine 1-phosphate receptor 2-like n=1 Tax=Mytilus trossulus TaxID=6551 RepID=UPI003007510F
MRNWTDDVSTEMKIGGKIHGFTISAVIILLNLPAAALSIVPQFRGKIRKSLYIVSIGITDVLVGVSSFVMTDLYENVRVESYVTCRLKFVLFNTAFIASMVHILAISLQRLYIMHKMSKSVDIGSKQWHIIIASWVISLVSNGIVLIWSKREDVDTVCRYYTGNDEQKDSLYSGIVLIFIIIANLATIVAILVKIGIYARSYPNSTISKSSIRMIVNLLIITVMYIVCVVPLACVQLYSYSYPSFRSNRPYAFAFAMLNSICNPIVYIIKLKEYRSVLVECLKFIAGKMCGGCGSKIHVDNPRNTQNGVGNQDNPPVGHNTEENPNLSVTAEAFTSIYKGENSSEHSDTKQPEVETENDQNVCNTRFIYVVEVDPRNSVM